MRVTTTTSFLCFVLITVGYVNAIGMELFGNYQHKIIEDNEDSQNSYDHLFDTVLDTNNLLFDKNNNPVMVLEEHIIKKRAIDDLSPTEDEGSGDDIEVDTAHKEIEKPTAKKNNNSTKDAQQTSFTKKDIETVQVKETSADEKTKMLNETAKIPLIQNISSHTNTDIKADDSKLVEIPKTIKTANVSIPKAVQQAETTTVPKVIKKITSNTENIHPTTAARARATNQSENATTTKSQLKQTPTPFAVVAKTTKDVVQNSSTVVNNVNRAGETNTTASNIVEVKNITGLVSSTTNITNGIETTTKTIVAAVNLSEINDMNQAEGGVANAKELQDEDEPANKNSERSKIPRKMNSEPLNKGQSGLVMLNTNTDTLEDTEKAVGHMKPNESIQNDSEPKTGQSSEKETPSTTETGRTDSRLIIILGAAVMTVGVAAFTYNFVRRQQMQRRQQENNNAISNINEDPEAGRELKPLMMKNNGDKNSKQHNVDIVESKDDTVDK